MENQIEQILSRLTSLESVSLNTAPIDYADPPIYFADANGVAVDTSSYEKLPDTVKDLPIFNGDPRELNCWIEDEESLVRLYQTNLSFPLAVGKYKQISYDMHHQHQQISYDMQGNKEEG